MKNTINLIIAHLILGVILSNAQGGKLKKANEKFNQFAYIDAAEIYLDVAESGYKSEELFKKLGDTYYFNAKYVDAARWYGELLELTESIMPIYYLRYSQSLKAIGKDDISAQWFDKYAIKANLSGKEFENAEGYLQIIEENSSRYTMEHLNINTKGKDFGGTLIDNKFVFASTKTKGRVSEKNRNAWDGLSYLDLYTALINEDGSLGEPVKLQGDVNTKFHESSAVFTKDGKTMYFTRNNTSPKIKRSKKEIQYLKIYRASLVNGKWINIEDLSINGDNYSTAHPTLNPSENKLYYVSDMPPSKGQTDLFVVTINKDGTLGKPTNLGEKINTKGRESFPYITRDNELYFSSDGHYGLGGYDVFYVKLKGNGYTGSLLNVGEPVNSSFDDIAFVIDDHKGYVSSNRFGGQGYDDIYSFIETKDIKELTKSKVFGVVTDKETKELLSNAVITIVDEDNKEFASLQTDVNGYYVTEVDRSASYIIKALKDEYGGDDVFSKKNKKEREHNFELSRNVFKVKEGDDIAKLLNIIIYFDFDKSYIRQDAALELEKIIAVMKQNPTIKLDVRSHTDSRANDAYNMRLSQRRNVSTLQYIIEQGGISANRLIGRGYGETLLINTCGNDIECSEEMHQANRRSEFVIIKK